MSVPSNYVVPRLSNGMPPARPLAPRTALAAASPTGRNGHLAAQSAWSPPSSLTWSGVLLFLVTLMIPLSAWMKFRIEVGALKVHAYLVPTAFFFLYVAATRLHEFPRATLYAMIVFVGWFCTSTLFSPGAPEEIAKIMAGGVTIVTAALMVRSTGDFRLGVFGLVMGITGLAILAVVTKAESFVGANPLQGSNENAFSLFTLPAALLAGYLALERSSPKWMRVMCVGSLLVIILQTFSSANRSGWLGIFVVGLMLLFSGKGYKLRAILFLVVMLGAGYWVVRQYGDLTLLKYRYDESFTANTADDLRIRLLKGCIQLGLENPVLGVSPQMVQWRLPDLADYHHFDFIDAHNAFGYVIGGSGLFATAALFYLGWTLFRSPPKPAQPAPQPTDGRAKIMPHRLLRLMLVLWVMRGNFSREILYSPSFCIGLGMVIGLCIVHQLWKPQVAAPPLRQPQRVPQPQPLALAR